MRLDREASLERVLAHRARAFGTLLPLSDIEDLGALGMLAQIADDHGCGAFFVEEHPSSTLDPIVTLAHLGQHRHFDALGMMVAHEKARLPSFLAKQVAGIDVVAGGRTCLVLGDLSDGVSGAQLLEQAELVGTMLDSDETTFHGSYYAVDRAWNTPRDTRPLGVLAKVSVAMSVHQLERTIEEKIAIPGGVMVECARPFMATLANLRGSLGDTTRLVGVVDVSLEDAMALGDEAAALVDTVIFRWEHLPLPDAFMPWCAHIGARSQGARG